MMVGTMSVTMMTVVAVRGGDNLGDSGIGRNYGGDCGGNKGGGGGVRVVVAVLTGAVTLFLKGEKHVYKDKQCHFLKLNRY